MIGLYYWVLTLALLSAGPFLLLSKKARAGLFQKLGFIPKELKNSLDQTQSSQPRVWFHAVSVGEFNALFPLLEEFHKRQPNYKIFITSTTRTGQELAQTKASSFAQVFYFPFDLPWITSKFLDLIKPDLVGIVETEIWPGFMDECQKRQIKVILLNGRLSPRSFKGYMRWRWFFKPVASKFSALAVQSESERERFLALGANDKHLSVCGNIKLDGLKACPPEETALIREKLNLKSDELVVVAGSTHEGEETAFLNALLKLNGKFRLILVPRHPERFERVAQIIESKGFRPRRFSRLESFESSDDVYLLNTIGQLNKFYSLADIAFVGGTIAKIGGHNLAEPCVYGTPVICGSHIHKAKDLFQKLSECSALIQVHDEKELTSTLQSLLDSPEKRSELGENGKQFLADSQGALAKTLALLEEYLGQKSTETQAKVETASGGLRR